jgi:hypothetical protein
MTKEVEQLEQEPKVMIPEFADDLDLGEVMPTMNVTSVPIQEAPEEKCIVADEAILSLYDEIINNCRKDRESIDDLLKNFIDMVLNDGDASSASKEAMVNLIKIKSDTADKMAKVADLMTRMKLKERDTFPRYLAAHQHNNVTIKNDNTKRDLLKAIQMAKRT